MHCKPHGRGAWVFGAILAFVWCAASRVEAASPPPRLAVLGKTVNYRQAADGSLRRLNYHFFAEIFLAAGGEGAGRLIDPSGRVTAFQSLGDILSIPGETHFTSLQELRSRIPDGRYRLEFEAPGLQPIKGSLNLQLAEHALADPVHLSLLQDGKAVAAAAIDPGKPLTIAWSAFAKGRADPNGIIDDLIFVHVGDCLGQVIARTPAPFAAQPAMTFRAASYTVPANTLRAGVTYQVSVEHAPLQTSRLGVMPALTTYPATTFLDFQTAGARSETCPATPYRMDNGQSDRESAPQPASAAQSASQSSVQPLTASQSAPQAAQHAAPLSSADDVRFFVIVKSSNYAQEASGKLRLLNYHFFSEIFPSAGREVSGELAASSWAAPKPYLPHGDTRYVEGGHFQSLEALDAAYPNGTYRVSIKGPKTDVKSVAVQLSGPRGKTDIPAPIRITVEQGGRAIAPTLIDAGKPTTLRWTPFSNGRVDPRGIVDDMIFVVVQDCRGKRIFHTGLPFDGPYTRHDVTQVQLPANLMQPGQPYAMFVEMPHVADSTRVNGIPGFASYATATYLDLKTVGSATESCPAQIPAMDTGQTDRAPGSSHITDQVTFLYYDDLAAPRRFYGEILGLPSFLTQEWVSLYRTAPGAAVGLVKVDRNDTTAALKRSVVMVSLVTDDVDGWYEKLRNDPRLRIAKPIYNHPQVGIRAFEMEDPGGYPVEIYQWLTPP